MCRCHCWKIQKQQVKSLAFTEPFKLLPSQFSALMFLFKIVTKPTGIRLVPFFFQNCNKTNRNTSGPPVMLDPMLLHWEGNFDFDHYLTSHLQAKLIDTDQSNLLFGSDEESASLKAMTFVLSTCHSFVVCKAP